MRGNSVVASVKGEEGTDVKDILDVRWAGHDSGLNMSVYSMYLS